MSNHPANRVRTCATTGLNVCLEAQRFIKLNAVLAVVCLLMGGLAAIGLVLTRWPAVHLLPADWFYRVLTLHGLNMLIFWILFFEVALLYFTSAVLLNTRLAAPRLAWLSWLLMTAGAAMVNFTVFSGKSDVLMTSYVPLKAHWSFYLGIILVAVGTLVAVGVFFGTLYIAKRDKTYQGSVPLVTFGALAAAIIAVVTILHGAAIMIPAFLWSLNLIDNVDAGVYRLLWWGLGHPAQQVNVCAQVAIWYLLASITTGARPLNQLVCRSAFLLYILFINLASAHHLLVDPGLGASWKIWNTSYAMYLAVLASMMHGFTVPAATEVAMRSQGHQKGLFGWLVAAPWRNPGFSAFFLSLVIFGFFGGITGVTIGTQQINIIAHNTLRLPGHFHTTVVGGTTLAFMGLVYYLVPLIFQREFFARKLCRWQPYIFGFGITIMAIGMNFAGSYGVPRRHWDMEFSGAQFAIGFDPAAHLMMGLVGIGGTLAFIGLLIFILITVATVFFGRSCAGRTIPFWGGEEAALKVAAAGGGGHEGEGGHKVSGTIVLVIVFLACFAVYFFANWKALADVWHVR